MSLGITPEGAVADFTKPHFGLLSVHVGRVRDVKDELDVVQDGDEHAIITGLPYSYDENGNEDIYQKAAAQDLAKKLLEVARPYEP